MFYILSEIKGFIYNYQLVIDTPNLPRELSGAKFILSELDFISENIDDISNFISYASSAKASISFTDYSLYQIVLTALNTSGECRIYKEGNLCFIGNILDRDNIEFDNEGREITFSIVNRINELKNIKVSDVYMEDYFVYPSPYNSRPPVLSGTYYLLTDVIKVYFQLIGINQNNIHFRNLENVCTRVVDFDNGSSHIRNFYNLYFEFIGINQNPDLKIWDLLKEIFNLFLLDCFIVDDTVIIQNKFIWRNPHIQTENLNFPFSLNTSYSIRQGKNSIKAQSDLREYTQGVNIGDDDSELIITTSVIDCLYNGNYWHGFGAIAGGYMVRTDFFALTQYDQNFKDLLQAFCNVAYGNLYESKMLIKTSKTGEFDITKFYQYQNRYYKVVNYSFNVKDHKSDISLVEVKNGL